MIKKRNLLLAFCLLIIGFAIESCNSSSSGSSIVGEWEYLGTTWTFYGDGSFSVQSWDFSNSGYLGIGKPNFSSGNYKIKGNQLILDYSGEHYEYSWSKPDENHLTFGNDAAGYWKCQRKQNEGNLSTDLVTNPKSATENSAKQAAISFDKTEHDFGTLLQGEVVTYSFHFTNTGNAPLLISQVTSSCGCTVGDYPHNPIDPGKDGIIKATYNSSGHHGFQNRYLTVMSNTMPAKNVLQIKGKVLTPDQY